MLQNQYKEPVSKTWNQGWGENVLFIKKVFCYPNDINDNAFDREVLGAFFEPYSRFVRSAELIQNLSKSDLSTFFQPFFSAKIVEK